MPSKTHDFYWGIAGVLISLGLLNRTSANRADQGRGNLAVGTGAIILGVKIREWLAEIRQPS